MELSKAMSSSFGTGTGKNSREIVDAQQGVTFYANALKSCSRPQDLLQGRQLHACILGSEHHRNRFLGNLIVEMYGKCGSLEEASKAFNQIDGPNVFSWNIMMTAYAQNGHLLEARCMFDTMPQRDVVSWNTMLSAYTQNGYIQEAESLFNEMPMQNVVSWNTMIVAYTDSGFGRDAIRLLKTMDHEGVQTSKITFIAVLAACGSQNALLDGKLVHAEIANLGLDSDVAVGTALINMYGKCNSLENTSDIFDKMVSKNSMTWNTTVTAYAQNGYLQEARSLFDKMPHPSVVSWNAMITAYAQNGYVDEARSMFDRMPDRDVVSWTAIISAYAQNGHGRESIDLFKKMDLEGMQPDNITFVTILDACAILGRDLPDSKAIDAAISDSRLQLDGELAAALINMHGTCENLEDAKSLFDSVPHKRIGLFNAMIAAYVHNRQGKRAIVLFQKMLLDGMQPNETTLLNIMDACIDSAALCEARVIHTTVIDDKFTSSNLVGTALVTMYGKLGSLCDARSTFDRLLHPNVVSWTVMITIYAQTGHPKEALALFIQMSLGGIQPDGLTLTSILTACSHTGLFNESLHYFVSMHSDYGIKPTIDHFVCIIDLLGRAGQLDEAEHLIHHMPLEANDVAWTALLGACQTSGDVDRGVGAAKHAFELNSANAGPYMLLSNIYAGRSSQYRFLLKRWQPNS